jgi:outer membrane protein TolC
MAKIAQTRARVAELEQENAELRAQLAVLQGADDQPVAAAGDDPAEPAELEDQGEAPEPADDQPVAAAGRKRTPKRTGDS